MFTITVQGASLVELQGGLQAAADALAGPPTGYDAAPAKPAAAKPAAAKPKPEPEADDAGEMVYATDVQPHIVKLSKVHGREAAVDILGGFEDEDGNACVSGKNVQPSDWPALVKKVQARQKKLDKDKAAAAEGE